MKFLFFIIPILALVLSVLLSIRSIKKGAKKSRALAMQMLSFVFVSIICCTTGFFAFAAENNTNPANNSNATVPEQTQQVANDHAKEMGLLSAALVTAISGIGGGIAVAAAAPAAIGATSEDPQSFGKALIFVALGEGIALYGLLVSILILAKV